jgi:transcriptional regulator with XRE-family HTH domain
MKGSDFRRLIEAADLDTKQVAELLGVGRSTVYRWLNDETPISPGNVLLIRSRIKVKKR